MIEPYKGPDNIYWLFSSSAQTISAFIAFILTGFALVISVMDGLAAKDETLVEIHNELKVRYYGRVRFLIINTGAAIFFSLLMVYLNGTTARYKDIVLWAAILCNILSLVLGITFVLSIINPSRYRITAREILDENKQDFSSGGRQIDIGQFMTEFIKLEETVRDIVGTVYQFAPSMGSGFNSSFRGMIMALQKSGTINYEESEELIQISKYRNLVVHGAQKEVDSSMLSRVVEMNQKLRSRI